MALAYRSGTASAASTTTSRTGVTKPSGTVDGDILIAMLYGEDDAFTGTPAITGGGWTAVHDTKEVNASPDVNFWSWLKVAASEGASYDLTWGGDSIWNQAVVIAFSGGNTSTPQDATATENSGNLTATPTGLGITTVTDGAMLVWLAANFEGVTTSGYSAPLVEQIDTGGTTNITVATGLQATAGASGNKTATYSANAHWVVHMLALRPAAAGGGPIQPPRSMDQFRQRRTYRRERGLYVPEGHERRIWMPGMRAA